MTIWILISIFIFIFIWSRIFIFIIKSRNKIRVSSRYGISLRGSNYNLIFKYNKQIAVTTSAKFVSINADGDYVETNTLWFYPSVLFDALEQSLHDEDDQYVIARVRALADADKRNERLRLILIGARIDVRRQTHAAGEVSDKGHAYTQDCFSTRITNIRLGDAGKRVMRQTLAAIDAADMQTFCTL